MQNRTRKTRYTRGLQLTFVIVLLQFQACYFTCNLGYSGKVIDDKTEEPIEGVEIKYYDDGTYLGTSFTTEKGEFLITGESHSKFAGSKCDELKLEFSKPNYQTSVETTNTGELNAVIRLRN